jgi:hypothetical protein
MQIDLDKKVCQISLIVMEITDFNMDYQKTLVYINLIFKFWLGVFNQTTDFLVNFISSEKDINSVQFAFTAVLTLLIPLIITLFEKRDEFNTLDKKLIEEISLIRSIFSSIVVVSVLYVLASKINQPDFYKFSSLIIIVCFGFLAVQTMRIVNFILNRDKYRAEKIRTANNKEVLDYFEDFFLGSQNSESSAKENKNFTQRQNQKIFSKEQLMVGLFTENLTNKFDKLGDQSPETIGFINEMLTILNSSLENINASNIIYPVSKEQKSSLLQKIFEWHFTAWEIKVANTNIDTNKWWNYSSLMHSLSDLIKKFVILSLEKDRMSYTFWSNLKPFLEKNYNEKIDRKNQKGETVVDFYADSIPIWDTLFKNIEKSKTAGYSSIKDFFPNVWRVTLNIDFEKNKFNNIVSKFWLFKFNGWFFNTFQTEYRRQENESFDNRIRLLLGLLFPKIDYHYWGVILYYWAGFSWEDKESGRITKMIGESFPNWNIVDDGYEMAEYYNNEEEFQKRTRIKFETKQNLSIQLATTLFKDIFTKNLPEDLKEIKELKNETPKETEQFQRLKIIEEIWGKLNEKLNKSTQQP